MMHNFIADFRKGQVGGNCCVYELSVSCVYLLPSVIATEFELQPVQSTASLIV